MSIVGLIELLLRVLLALLSAGSNAVEGPLLPTSIPAPVEAPVLPTPTPVVVVTPTPTPAPIATPVPVAILAVIKSREISSTCYCPDPILCELVALFSSEFLTVATAPSESTTPEGQATFWLDCIPPSEFPIELTQELLEASRVESMACEVKGCEYVPGYEMWFELPDSPGRMMAVRFFYQAPGQGFYSTNVLGIFAFVPNNLSAESRSAIEDVLSTLRTKEPPTVVGPPPIFGPPPTDSPGGLDLVAVSYRVTAKNSVWWRFAWQATIKNTSARTMSFDIQIKFLDSDGFIVDTDREYFLSLSSGEDRTFTGFGFVDTDVANDVKSVQIEILSR